MAMMKRHSIRPVSAGKLKRQPVMRSPIGSRKPMAAGRKRREQKACRLEFRFSQTPRRRRAQKSMPWMMTPYMMKPERQAFFNAVYEQAAGDAAFVPWADLKAKEQLNNGLRKMTESNPHPALTAMDVACGLGDNAEALARAGYATTAFDLAGDAIDWAKKRFPESAGLLSSGRSFRPAGRLARRLRSRP